MGDIKIKNALENLVKEIKKAKDENRIYDINLSIAIRNAEEVLNEY